MTTLAAATTAATKHLMTSDKARTYQAALDVWGKRSKYVIELERSEDGRSELIVTTWGFDYESIKIPQTRSELIAAKCRAQFDMATPINQIALRYYLDILKRESN